jgi:hypothetical protein
MDKVTLEAYLQLHKELKFQAMLLWTRYRDLFEQEFRNNATREYDDSHLFVDTFDKTEEGNLVYVGEDSIPGEGHTRYTFELPISYLSDPDWESKVLAKFAAQKQAVEDKKSAAKEQKIKQDQEFLAKLQKEYPEMQICFQHPKPPASN